MVSQLTALTKSGLKDWFIQRLSAVILGLYVIFIVAFLFAHPHPTFIQWSTLFSYTWMKILSLIVLISVLAHAWIGFWTVLTDYVHCSALRGLIQVCVILAIFACFVYGILILWS